MKVKEEMINGIQTRIADTEDQASTVAAQLIADQVREKPASVLGLATGGTPMDTYRRLVQMNRDGEISFAQVTTFNLDEYIGLAPDHPQSYRAFMNENLFQHIDIDLQNTHVPSGLAADIAAECESYESKIRSAGGIDLQLLGLGHNGHIAFNEPGSPAESRTRQVDLTSETIEKNSRFFESVDQVPRHAITMGIATILESRRIVMLALGESKADAVARMLRGLITSSHPASELRNHPAVTVVLDQASASKLGPAELSSNL